MKDIFEYPADYVGSSNGVVVLEEPEESPYVNALTEFFGFEMLEDRGDFYKLTTSEGETMNVKKSNVERIERNP